MTLLILIGIAIFLWIIFKKGSKSSNSNTAATNNDFSHLSNPSNVGSSGRSVGNMDTMQSFRLSTGSNTIISNYEWIPYGKSVNIAGYDILGGMVYVGKSLASVNGAGLEPALINPTLQVYKQNPDVTGTTMGYWPSYSAIAPKARAAYLSWLSSGRTNPDAYIGYVFLYFYGLERRLLYDLQQGDKQTNEIREIIGEVKRLLKIYGGNGSFGGYASRFLDIATVLGANDDNLDNFTSDGYNNYEIPLGLKLKLGKLAIEGKPLSSELAMSYIENNPMEISPRTPARRCPTEFKRLFHIRYTEKHGQGILLKTNKTPLKTTYRPSSASFGGEVSVSVKDVPDVTVLKQPWQNIIEMADSCVQELDAYSRYLGRNPDKANTAEAQALLPKKLLSVELSGEMKHLSEHLLKLSGERETFSAQLFELLDQMPTMAKDALGKKEAVSLAQILEKLGYGIEPDVRFYGQVPKTNDQVIIFKISDESASSPSVDYSSAALMVQLSAMVASADGTVSAEEERIIVSHLESLYHLADNEKTRLRGLMAFHLQAKTSLAGSKKRIEGIKQAERELIGRFITGIAHADNKIDPAEVKTLEKLYKGLGLDVQALYSALHSACADPVTIVTADKDKKQYAIPSKPAEKKSAVELDKALVSAKMHEAAAVSSLLSTIFAGDDAPPSQPTVPQTSESLNGMDVETASFFKQLIERTSWQREELEGLADKANIMLDGVLESINDACFDKCGEPLFEDGDTIEINEKVAKEMMA